MTRNPSANAASAPVPGVSRGITYAMISILAAPLIDVFSKLAAETLPPVEITAGRFLVQALVMVPFLLWRAGPKALQQGTRRNTQAFHAMRGALITISMLSFVTTLRVMELADAIAIFFVEPVILTVLGAIFLKETVGWRRYTACAVGFSGAMLVIQPSFQEVGAIAFLPVVAAFAIAVFALLTRMQAQKENPFSMQFQTGLWGLGFCLAIMAAAQLTGLEDFSPVWPDTPHLGFMLATGLAAAFTGILSVFSYRYAPASTLAPLQYMEIVSATALGWLVFNDFPDGMKWLGIAIIIASGLYIIWRERRVKTPIITAVQETTTP
ncbi:MAG: hypothetical protein DI589_21300 [Shinella sp.]|nr:MAG: hypothetical protein DI589_21300 [Shinella sp.]